MANTWDQTESSKTNIISQSHQWRSCCDHPRICQKTIKKYKTVSPEPLFQTEYFNRCLLEQLHTQKYSWLEQSTIRCNSDTNHGLLQGSCVEASDTVIWKHVAFNCKFCWYYQFLTRAQWLTLAQQNLRNAYCAADQQYRSRSVWSSFYSGYQLNSL